MGFSVYLTGRVHLTNYICVRVDCTSASNSDSVRTLLSIGKGARYIGSGLTRGDEPSCWYST